MPNPEPAAERRTKDGKIIKKKKKPTPGGEFRRYLPWILDETQDRAISEGAKPVQLGRGARMAVSALISSLIHDMRDTMMKVNTRTKTVNTRAVIAALETTFPEGELLKHAAAEITKSVELTKANTKASKASKAKA